MLLARHWSSSPPCPARSSLLLPLLRLRRSALSPLILRVQVAIQVRLSRTSISRRTPLLTFKIRNAFIGATSNAASDQTVLTPDNSIPPEARVGAPLPLGPDAHVVAARQGKILVTSFHPELTGDRRFHEWWIKECVLSDYKSFR
jgi:hypothetical protein